MEQIRSIEGLFDKYLNLEKKYNTIIFDLDGTLFNSSDVTAYAINEVVKEVGEKYKLYYITEQDTRKALGTPVPEYYKVIFPHLNDREVNELAPLFAKKESELILDGRGGALFSLVREVIEFLYKKNFTLALATNSSYKYMETVLKKFGLWQFFSYTMCVESEGGMTKPEMVAYIKKVADSPFVMVGDRVFDFYAARDNDIDFIFCSYGYKDLSTEMINDSRVVGVLNTFPEILDYVFKK